MGSFLDMKQVASRSTRAGLCTFLLLFCFFPFVSFAGSQYDIDFPDIILCNIDTIAPNSSYVFAYAVTDVDGIESGANDRLYFNPYYTTFASYNSDGTFNAIGATFVSSNCDGFSIAQLYSNGQAFDFGTGGSGTTTNIYNSTTTGSSSSSGGNEVGVVVSLVALTVLLLLFMSKIFNIST